MKVIVVGAGIAGLSTAWALTRRGHDVVLFEQGSIPNPYGASGDHHRIIRRAYGSHQGYAAAIDEAFAAWNELWQALGQSHLDPRGFLCTSYAKGDGADLDREGLEEGGYPFELVPADEALRRWPFLGPEGLRYALFSAEGGVLHCRRISTGIAEWLRANGADLRENCKVEALDVDGATVTLTGGHVVAADRLVVTAGAWVVDLFPDLAVDLHPFRTAVAYLEPPEELAAAWASAPALLDIGEASEGYVVPPSGDGGLKFGTGLHRAPLSDPALAHEALAGEGEAIRVRFAGTIADLEDYRVRLAAPCVYTFTNDQTFYGAAIGNAVVVSACSGHGYKFGAAVGLRVAEAVETGDVAALRHWLRADGTVT